MLLVNNNIITALSFAVFVQLILIIFYYDDDEYCAFKVQ